MKNLLFGLLPFRSHPVEGIARTGEFIRALRRDPAGKVAFGNVVEAMDQHLDFVAQLAAVVEGRKRSAQADDQKEEKMPECPPVGLGIDFTHRYADNYFPSSRRHGCVTVQALDAGGVLKAINAKGFAGITIGQVDELTEIAKLHGAKGLAFIKYWSWDKENFGVRWKSIGKLID